MGVPAVELPPLEPIVVAPDPELISYYHGGGLGFTKHERDENLGSLRSKLRHPLHHAKYMIITLAVNTILFPLEHLFWADVIGWTP